jgi:hypothetical protein
VNHDNSPEADWNQIELYDPGADFTDWVGISLYGAQRPSESQKPVFSNRYAEIRDRLVTLAGKRPIMISEFGCTKTTADPTGRDVANWAHDALTSILAGKWPEVRGFSWWNEGWSNGSGESPTEMRVQKVPALQEMFRTVLGNAGKQLVETPSLIEA